MTAPAHASEADGRDISHATFVRPDLGSFCRLDELGLQVVGQRLEPGRAVLACRVVETDEFARIGCSKVSADVTQGELHVSRRSEAINAGWGACLDEKLRKVRVQVGAERSRVSHRFAGHGHRIRERMMAVAEELIEQYADGEQVGGDIPPGEAGVGWLISRCA